MNEKFNLLNKRFKMGKIFAKLGKLCYIFHKVRKI